MYLDGRTYRMMRETITSNAYGNNRGKYLEETRCNETINRPNK
jgi:hypothetical protein